MYKDKPVSNLKELVMLHGEQEQIDEYFDLKAQIKQLKKEIQILEDRYHVGDDFGARW